MSRNIVCRRRTSCTDSEKICKSSAIAGVCAQLVLRSTSHETSKQQWMHWPTVDNIAELKDSIWFEQVKDAMKKHVYSKLVALARTWVANGAITQGK